MRGFFIARGAHHRDERWSRRILATGLAAFLNLTSPVSVMAGSEHRDAVDYPTVPPEKRADVILVFTPDTAVPLHLAAPTDRVLRGNIVRFEKGASVPRAIIHKRGVIGSPLEAGVPVTLFLKSLDAGGSYYIIAVGPEWYGAQP